MFINPRHWSPEAAADMDRQVQARYESGQPDALIQTLMGDLDQASKATKDLIFGLRHFQGITPARDKDGHFGVHVGDIQSQRDALLVGVNKALRALFQDYGIDMRRDVTFAVAQDGRIEVANPHPDADQIETLVNGSALLRNSIAKILSDSGLIAGIEAQKGPGDMALTLGADGSTVVDLFDQLMATSSPQKSRAAETEEQRRKREEQERLTKEAIQQDWERQAAFKRAQLERDLQTIADMRWFMGKDKPYFL